MNYEELILSIESSNDLQDWAKHYAEGVLRYFGSEKSVVKQIARIAYEAGKQVKAGSYSNDSELKPCPFCGGKAELMKSEPGLEDRISYKVVCANFGCQGAHCNLWQINHEEAIKAWNTRYEPTCKRVEGGKKYGSIKLVCSECGYGLGDMRHNYCPNCGARVIKQCSMNRVYLYDEEEVDGIECSECGYSEIHDHSEPLPNECQNCGAKVVE